MSNSIEWHQWPPGIVAGYLNHDSTNPHTISTWWCGEHRRRPGAVGFCRLVPASND